MNIKPQEILKWAIIGAFVGFLISQFFPWFSDEMFMAFPPFSDARLSLLTSYVFGFAVTGAAVGYHLQRRNSHAPRTPGDLDLAVQPGAAFIRIRQRFTRHYLVARILWFGGALVTGVGLIPLFDDKIPMRFAMTEGSVVLGSHDDCLVLSHARQC